MALLLPLLLPRLALFMVALVVMAVISFVAGYGWWVLRRVTLTHVTCVDGSCPSIFDHQAGCAQPAHCCHVLYTCSPVVCIATRGGQDTPLTTRDSPPRPRAADYGSLHVSGKVLALLSKTKAPASGVWSAHHSNRPPQARGAAAAAVAPRHGGGGGQPVPAGDAAGARVPGALQRLGERRGGPQTARGAQEGCNRGLVLA